MKNIFFNILFLILIPTAVSAEKYEVTLRGRTAVVEATKEDLKDLKKKAHELFIAELLSRGLAKKVQGGVRLVEDADLSFYDFRVVEEKERPAEKSCQDFIKEIK